MKSKERRQFIKLGLLSTLGCSVLPFKVGAELFKSESAGDDLKFFQACLGGDLHTVKNMLAGHPQFLNSFDADGRSGFALALLNGHESISEYIKTKGYITDLHESALDLDWERFTQLTSEDSLQTIENVNSHHPLGGSAMWAAAAGGAGSEIWRVYARCGDPNRTLPNSEYSTPLQRALQYMDLNVAEITAATLMGNDADPDPPSNSTPPPLHLAAERGSTIIIEMLIRLGADPERKCANNLSARDYAEKNGHQESWEFLINHEKIARTCRSSRQSQKADGSPYQFQDITDIPPFERAHFVGQSHGNLDYVKEQLARDPRLAHSIATTNEKCVEACAHTGRKAIVELLLEHGAPYSLPTAVMLGDMDTVKRLLDEDPRRIYERGAHDFALLWYPVIGQCDLDMTQLLLDRGARIEEQHYLGTTALHWACMRGNLELVEMLVENGAEINRVGKKFNPGGQRPLELTKDEKVAKFLSSRGAY